MSKKKVRVMIIVLLMTGLSLLVLLVVSSGCTQKYLMKKVYKLEYQQYVHQAAKKYNVEEALVYAVIKSESNFTVRAESRAGAKGLMQLMPDTFTWLQRYTDDEYMDETYLADPKINIDYGTHLLSILLNKYDCDEVAISAYNAGMGTVDRWLLDQDCSYDGKTLSYIPYPETRFYVDEVIYNRKIYRNLYF